MQFADMLNAITPLGAAFTRCFGILAGSARRLRFPAGLPG
jgi:hypothetical protein